MPRFILVLCFLFASCATTVSTKPDASKFYKRDLYIYSLERTGTGTVVLPKSGSYSIYVESDGRINMLTFRTCSREISIQDPRQGISRKKFTITYTPNEIEQSGICQTEIMAFNIEGKNSFGFVDYEDSENTLIATNVCGGITELTGGVSICQERMGLIEKIKFNEEVIVDEEKRVKCGLDRDRGTEFSYSLARGICVIAFVGVKSKKVHRHTTIGYDDILISI